MIRINLLPFRAARKKENIRKQVSIFVLSLFLVIIIASWFSYVLSGRVKSLDEKIATAKAQVEKYNKINREIAQIKKNLNLLKKKIEVIESLDLTRKAPVDLLNDMSQLVVENQMWLTSLKEHSGKIQVAGIALDNPTVAEYMTRLESSKKYTGVKLRSISQESVKGLKLKKFSIDFRKVAPKKEKPNR